MQTASKQLPDDIQQLKDLLLVERGLSAKKDAELVEKDVRIEALSEQYQQILEQFRLAQQKQFCQSSEASAKQLGLFNEAEQALAEDGIKTEQETLTYTRNKPKRKPLPKDLPRDTNVHDIADTTCTCCSHDLHRMGEETSEQLEFIPASIKIAPVPSIPYTGWLSGTCAAENYRSPTGTGKR